MLKQTRSLSFLLFIIGVAVIGSLSFVIKANALNITVYDNITDNTYMAEGSLLSGSFDINPAIPTNSEYQIPYDVQNAYYTFKFTDDGDMALTLFSNTTSYIYWSRDNNIYYYIRYQHNYYIDQFEQVTLNMEGEYSIHGTEWYSMQQTSEPSFDYAKYRWPWYSYKYYTVVNNTANGYTGNITLYQSLGSAALQSLSDDGIVNFTLQASYGDLYYNFGRLDAEINPNAVPEPFTMLLVGFGLVGLAGFRRTFAKV